ncbi:MAG: hypothetical protein IMF00_01235 [Proteobacteria bacterium]|jgi:hypothetical protein|nr:hypothetical protein [Pseudomonadota bacterium]OEU61703.1 MAG: hypothetical protein BA867_02595 [Desulfobacterales bacterium S5133MH16]
MSKIKLICFVCISLLFFGTSVQANLRSSQNDFTTKFRKEKFIGGGPGQQANVLTAAGQDFFFQNAALESVAPTSNPDGYMTIYTTEELVFRRGFNFDAEVEVIQTGYPLPDPPLPDPPLPLPTPPMT